MKKKTLAIVLILVLLTAVMFTAVACDDKDEDSVYLAFDEETGSLSWYHKDADKYVLEIYEKDEEGNYIFVASYEFNSASANTLPYDKDGDYIFVIKAIKDDTVIADKEIEITVKEKPIEEEKPTDSGDVDPESDLGEPVKILKNTYYYNKSDGGNLTIGLANTSGVKSVKALELIGRNMWKYDKDKNALIIESLYFEMFSVGVRLDMNIVYNDNETSDIYLQLVNTLPLEVIGGEDGVIDVDTTNSVLNCKISLGYNGKTLKEGSVKIIQKVCIDGKMRSTTDYITDTSNAIIYLLYSKVLSSLSAGMHYLEIYTSYGKSEVWLNVSNGRKNFPYNVQIDFDSSYPNIFITWDIYNENADYFIVEIGDAQYNGKDNPELFDGNKFNASGKINYGDSVVVKAVFDGKAQYSDISKTTLSVDIASPTISSYLSYDKSFEFLGKQNNYYISDFDEFFDMIYYGLLFYDELENSTNSAYEKMITFYPNTKAISNVNSSFTQVVERLNEAVKCDKLVESNSYTGVCTIYLKVQSSFVPNATPDVSSPPILENTFQDTHFSATGRASDYEDFAINKVEKQASVRLSEELYLAVERGIRPVPVEGTSAYEVYEKAKQVLRQIIDDDMNDYQKVHAMYDYLGRYVTYDWDINTKMSGVKPSDDAYNKFYKYRQFYLEGVFIDGLAVCNGIAKAMSLMCGIEGITCYKIKGTSGGTSGAHAWTKVKIDDNWYVVDATWANRTYTYNNDKKEILAHHTIFMSEATSGNTRYGAHYECYKGMYSDYYASEDYNVFANTFFKYNSNLYDYVIDSSAELYVLIDYYKDKCPTNEFITIDVSCDLAMLKSYLSAIKASFDGYNIEVSNYNGAMSGVSSVIISKR